MAKNRPPSMRITARSGMVSSSGCSARSRYTCVPASRPRIGIDGRVATLISQSSDSTIPTTTPRSTPTESTPRTAATAIQKSNRFTRRSRRNSRRSIIPKTTASMMIAARTALGSSEKSGASRISVPMTTPPGRQGGDRCPRPGRLVERAGRQAGRHRHALEHAGAEIGHALGHRLLVEVDAIAVPGGERLGIPRRLGEPDQQQREGRDDDGREVLRHELERRHLRYGKAARHCADERDAAGAKVEEDRARKTTDHEHEGARDPRKREAQPEDDGERDQPDEQRRRG